MRRIRLLIEYDGTDYHGWQSQKSGGTIQDILSEAIFSVTGEEVKLTGASRTDAGVHALSQVAAFRTGSRLSSELIMRALNAKLPADIRILEAEEESEGFHPRYDADRKSYFYILSPDRNPSAFLRKYVWYLKTPVDVTAMSEASQKLLGKHNFSSFRGAGCGAKHPVRTVHACEVAKLDSVGFMTAAIRGDFIRFRIEADAFLRHMVRNIVGSLVEVGRGRMSPGEFSDLLTVCDRTKAGPTAPARGLFLAKIIYRAK
ncbi:MAG: tRNA pseudouridine(38-40) synthase TruA [Candidatus Sulfobium sp.]